MIYKKLFTGMLLLLVLASCKKKQMSFKEFIAFMNEPANGLLKNNEDNPDILFSCKFLPGNYLTELEINKGEKTEERKQQYDSLIKGYANSMTFHLLLTTRKDKIHIRDMVLANAGNLESVESQLYKLEYEVGEQIKMIIGEKRLKPSIVIKESLLSNENKLSYVMVFPVALSEKELPPNIKITFDDIFLNTGSHDFQFKTSDLKEVPQIIN